MRSKRLVRPAFAVLLSSLLLLSSVPAFAGSTEERSEPGSTPTVPLDSAVAPGPGAIPTATDSEVTAATPRTIREMLVRAAPGADASVEPGAPSENLAPLTLAPAPAHRGHRRVWIVVACIVGAAVIIAAASGGGGGGSYNN